MTIPPNDAFTLTSHSDSTPSLRSSRSRSLTRSPSPKIAFTTSQHAVANGDSKRRRSRRQRKSSGFVSDSVKLADVDEALERALNGNGHANGISHPDKTIAPTAQAKKIDWEIPRKALHSSIGMSRDSIMGVWVAPPFFRLAHGLVPGFVTLYLYASHSSPERVVVMLSSAMVIIVPADILRLNYPRFERTYEKALGFLMRECEKVRQYHNHCSTPHLFRTKRRLTSSPPFGFAETFQWCDMVHPRGGLCTLAIPSRCRCIIYHDVSCHPFDHHFNPYLIFY
jgi:diacylglycerol kinase (CTP)